MIWLGLNVIGALGVVAVETSFLEQAYVLDAGEAGSRDAEAAAALYQQAADAGDAVAHLRLGYLYEVGDGVDQDYNVARSHYEQAMGSGLPEAGMRLAICHLEGWGGPVDREAFLREMTIAAESGYVPAQRAMVGIYFIGVGVPRDREAGQRWVERLAMADDAEAQVTLGRTLERGRARSLTEHADVELARTWYQLSAEQDFAEAMRAMARSLVQPGEGQGQADLTGARTWLELASEGGDPEAAYTLAILAGRAASRTASPEALAEMKRWIDLAAERGHDRATETRDMIEQGMPVDRAVRYVMTTRFEDRYMRKARRSRGAVPNADGVLAPLPVRLVKPTYPPSLRMGDTTGQAVIEFVVDTTGRVKKAKIAEATHPLFGEQALAAVNQWRFDPGEREGRKVNVRLKVPVVFRIDGHEIMRGVDGLLGWAKAEAESLGGDFAADAIDLRMAQPVVGLRRVTFSPEQPEPDDWKALLLLVLSPKGRVERAHVLNADPEWVGPLAIEAARVAIYRPRGTGTEAESGSVILPFTKKAQLHNTKQLEPFAP